MKRCGVDRPVLAVWLTLAVGCTEPTYGVSEDAASVNLPEAGGGGDAREAGTGDASTPAGGFADADGFDDSGSMGADTGGGSAHDAGLAQDAGPAQDAGATQDAGAPGEADASGGPGSDAGAPAAVLPTWARPLLGRYLKQSISVGFDTAIGMPVVSSERSLVTIVEEGDARLTMQIQMCSFNSQWWDQSLRFALAKPSTLPTVKLGIILGQAPHFSTETVDRAVGFDPARQTGCGGMGQRIAKFTDQVWLPGSTCTCATFPELPPQSRDDCRLTDPDGDRQPGVLISSTTGVFNFSIAMSTSLKVVDGAVAQGREHTLREQGRANVGCTNMGEDGCTLGAPAPCGDVVTDLRPLAADATCATVLAYNLPVGTLPVDKCPAKSP